MCTHLQKCAEYHHFFSCYFFHKGEAFHRTKPNDVKLMKYQIPKYKYSNNGSSQSNCETRQKEKL